MSYGMTNISNNKPYGGPSYAGKDAKVPNADLAKKAGSRSLVEVDRSYPMDPEDKFTKTDYSAPACGESMPGLNPLLHGLKSLYQ